DTPKDGLRGDGCRDRPLHAELKLFAENPALRARAPRQSCTGLIEAHGKQLFFAALEEVGSLGIVRCISHGCLFDAVKGAIQEAQNSSQGRATFDRSPSSNTRPRWPLWELASAPRWERRSIDCLTCGRWMCASIQE